MVLVSRESTAIVRPWTEPWTWNLNLRTDEPENREPETREPNYVYSPPRHACTAT